MISDPYREQEAEWLRGVVSSEEFRSAPVRIVFLHMPPSPKGWHGGAEISRLFVPILNQAGIDLMLSAHIHGYKLYPAGHKSTGCAFPVLCNPNRTRMDVEATAGRIECDIFDKEESSHTATPSRRDSADKALSRFARDGTACRLFSYSLSCSAAALPTRSSCPHSCSRASSSRAVRNDNCDTGR